MKEDTHPKKLEHWVRNFSLDVRFQVQAPNQTSSLSENKLLFATAYSQVFQSLTRQSRALFLNSNSNVFTHGWVSLVFTMEAFCHISSILTKLLHSVDMLTWVPLVLVRSEQMALPDIISCRWKKEHVSFIGSFLSHLLYIWSSVWSISIYFFKRGCT